MKKTILGAVAAAVLGGSVVLTPTPAAAYVFVLAPFILEAKKDPNFKAVNPYAKKKAAKRSSKKKKKKM